jgi:glutamyl-tRNA synthetase
MQLRRRPALTHDQITLMDWGNAIVRSKTTDSSGTITALNMELNLDGDFRKTKKITWLAQPSAAHPLVDATLIDYDYIITKKKLEENDDVKDFVTPVTEFREDALADANVRELKRGDIIQFERRGYFIFDGVVEKKQGDGDTHKTWEFIRIPDGRAAGLASKAGAPEQPKEDSGSGGATSSKSAKGKKAEVDRFGVTPADTKMYKVNMVVDTEDPDTSDATKMYKVDSVYNM